MVWSKKKVKIIIIFVLIEIQTLELLQGKD